MSRSLGDGCLDLYHGSVHFPVCCLVLSFHSSSLLTLLGQATFNMLDSFLPHVAFPPLFAHPVIMSSMHFFGCTKLLFRDFPCLLGLGFCV